MDQATWEREAEYWRLHDSHEPARLSSPAVGQPLVYTVPGSVEQELLAVSFTYTCSAGVANRVPTIRFLDAGGRAFCEVGTPFLLVATNVAQVTFGVGLQQFGANSAARLGAAIPPMRLGDGLGFELTATAIQAADTITAAAMFVRQWRVRP